MTSRLGLLLAAAIVVAVGVGWVSIRGRPWQKSEAAEAKEVVQPFVFRIAHRISPRLGPRIVGPAR